MKIYKVILLAFILSNLFQRSSFAQSGWQVQYNVPSNQLEDIYFLNDNTGWAVVKYPGNKFLKTTNRGVSWVIIPNQIYGGNGIYFYNEHTGWICGRSGQLFKTTNDGINWIISPNCNCNGSADDFVDIQFINENTGWAFGDTRIHKTTDGGENYFVQSSAIYVENGMFLDSLIGWLAGSLGSAYSIDGGNHWIRSYLPDSSSSSCIYFVNQLTGWVAGYGNVSKSTNGGINWIRENSGISRNTYMNKMQFVDVNTGWIACDSGIVIKTTNGGENWFKQITGTQYNIYGLHMINSQEGWLCGINYIFHTTDGGGPPVGINSISNEIPNKFLLSQNYPNPFNPTTKIKFEIPKSAFVKIVVYDAVGKEVETLTNEIVQAGIYEAEWNAVSYPSGVYYYKLSAGDFTETKKMILLK